MIEHALDYYHTNFLRYYYYSRTAIAASNGTSWLATKNRFPGGMLAGS